RPNGGGAKSEAHNRADLYRGVWDDHDPRGLPTDPAYSRSHITPRPNRPAATAVSPSGATARHVTPSTPPPPVFSRHRAAASHNCTRLFGRRTSNLRPSGVKATGGTHGVPAGHFSGGPS